MANAMWTRKSAKQKRTLLALGLAAAWLIPSQWLFAQDGTEEAPSTAAATQEFAARHFVVSDSCARCHAAVSTAEAMWSATGEDASPMGTWQASVMANSFRDPYWRAQLERELALSPKAMHAELTELCTRCHAPAAIHEARFDGKPAPSLAALDRDPGAQDGVACSVCHRIDGSRFGESSTFNGELPLAMSNHLFGPYPEPFDGPMAQMSGYEIQFGAHMVESALCATCHTLETFHGSLADQPEGHGFLEQSPYLEWRNSVYSHETNPTEASRSCQACHMPDMGSMTIAHNPEGGPFPFLEPRPEVRSHAIVGGNAMLLELLSLGREALGVKASDEALERMAAETRRFLSEETATVEVTDLHWVRERLRFSVGVENLTGHKLPSGYPSRRAWLEVQVTSGGETWFASGVPDAQGRILPAAAALKEPHRDTITQASEIAIYELIAGDDSGHATTRLSQMRKPLKDNRLLPKGWRADGPHAERTAPVGIGEDKDFGSGTGDAPWMDRVHFDLPIPASAQGPGQRPTITVRFLYQTIPPIWADDHRQGKHAAGERFIELYDKAPVRFEVLAETRRMAL